jgi:4-hydroxythreonine-4-phosphate dehydrogenase
MVKDEKIKVGISIGDLNGIGGEIILKTFADSRILEFCTPVIFASVKTMSFYKKHFKSTLQFYGINSTDKVIPGKVNVLNVWKENVNISFGKEDKTIGHYAIKSLKEAVKALKNEDIDVLLTAPIHKHNIQSETFQFPGHTDYLNQELEGESLMFMVSDELRVGLLTDHVPVKEVSAHINEALIQSKVNTVYNSLVEDFGIRKPKIAILGLNPHSGDDGVIGNEDNNIIKPAIKALKHSGKLVYGPYAADSFFATDHFTNFDAVVAAYHDQGLIPFKTLSFGKGVNFTAGLNRIRTSPDHGTAFEIAGKGCADHSSFNEALHTALAIYKNRKMYKALTANPLKTQKR